MILIDKREQHPYSFRTPSRSATLHTGDYSLDGSSGAMAVERKEVDDLIGCLCQGRDRFERELERSRELDYFALVIEASLSDLVEGNYRSGMLPRSAVQSLMAFSVRYRLPIFFCESRQYGQRVTESLLEKYQKEQA